MTIEIVRPLGQPLPSSAPHSSFVLAFLHKHSSAGPATAVDTGTLLPVVAQWWVASAQPLNLLPLLHSLWPTPEDLGCCLQRLQTRSCMLGPKDSRY